MSYLLYYCFCSQISFPWSLVVLLVLVASFYYAFYFTEFFKWMSRAFQLGYAARSLIEFIFILLPSISVISHVRTMRDWASLPLTPIKGPFSFTSGLSLQLFRQRICYNMSMINLSGERNFGCSTCKTHLATIHSLISRVSSLSSSPSLLYFTLLWILGFQWPTWSCISFWLRVSIHYHKVQSLQLTAYYFRRVNVVEGEPYDVPMTTGNHTIRDIYCYKCGTTLGRKYVNAPSISPTPEFTENVGQGVRTVAEVQGRQISRWA